MTERPIGAIDVWACSTYYTGAAKPQAQGSTVALQVSLSSPQNAHQATPLTGVASHQSVGWNFVLNSDNASSQDGG